MKKRERKKKAKLKTRNPQTPRQVALSFPTIPLSHTENAEFESPTSGHAMQRQQLVPVQCKLVKIGGCGRSVSKPMVATCQNERHEHGIRP